MSQNDLTPEQDTRKLTTPVANVIDVLLTAGFFVFMEGVAYPHTPDVSEKWKHVIAAYTSFCVSGIFWLAVQGLRVTWVDQVRRKKAGLKN